MEMSEGDREACGGQGGSDPASAAFEPLGAEGFRRLPHGLAVQAVEWWSKSRSPADRERARAMLGLLPKANASGVSRQGLAAAIRCATEPEAMAWLDAACAEAAALCSGQPAWARGMPMGAVDFSAEAVLALRRSKHALAERIAKASCGARMGLEVEEPGGAVRMVGLSDESLRQGAWGAFEAGFRKQHPGLLRARWTVDPERALGAAMRERPPEGARAAQAWKVFKRLYSGEAGEALREEALADLSFDLALGCALHCARDRALREDFARCAGEGARARWLAAVPPEKKAAWWGWLPHVAAAGEQAMVEEALAAVGFEALSEDPAPGGLSLAMELASAGGAPALRGLCAAAMRQEGMRGKEVLGAIAAKRAQLWAASDGQPAGEADAFAFCVASGDSDAALALLEALPDLDMGMASKLLGALGDESAAGHGGEAHPHGQALAAWDRIQLWRQAGQAPVAGQSGRL